jgi:hypothetical protein
VYNLFNATRLCEIKKFAQERDLIVKWQNLSGPIVLDPRIYGSSVAKLARIEIERMYDTCQVDESERQFFDTALAHFKIQKDPKLDTLHRLSDFIMKLETVYHPDSQGQFARLWPELASLCK